MINVYRMTKCVTTLGSMRYSIERFSLFSYIRVRGIRNTYKELRGGVLSFSPYKIRRAIRRLQKLDMWFYKEMMMSMINNGGRESWGKKK